MKKDLQVLSTILASSIKLEVKIKMIKVLLNFNLAEKIFNFCNIVLPIVGTVESLLLLPF